MTNKQFAQTRQHTLLDGRMYTLKTVIQEHLDHAGHVYHQEVVSREIIGDTTLTEEDAMEIAKQIGWVL